MRRAPRERSIGKEASCEEEERVESQQIICQCIRFAQGDDDANESNHRQADADHCRGDREDVNTNVFFEMSPGLSVCFHRAQFNPALPVEFW
jgi:hypothetical protein